jgi:oligoribonuclease (3'-5' exoribonuclease)
MKPLLFIDTETGGLDPQHDPLIEVAWAGITGPVHSMVLPHNENRVTFESRKINGYEERGLNDHTNWAKDAEIQQFVQRLKGVTLVGANVSFDKEFLLKHFCWAPQDAPWHYRTLDIESMAYGKLNCDEVPGMAKIHGMLVDAGYSLPAPDHTATGDVRALRASYKILRYM